MPKRKVNKKPKVAIVVDWLTDMGGAERVVWAMHEIWPDAPIYTTLHRPENFKDWQSLDIRTSYLQRWPFAAKHHRYTLPFMPAAIESLDLDDYDIVVSSSSSGCAKGIITKATTLHACYCHTPNRVLWDDCHSFQSLHKLSWWQRLIVPGQLRDLRMWDRCAADRVDHFIGNSHFVAKRIKKYYQRDAEVIHPPVDTINYNLAEKTGNYFLAVGRLIPYKRFDLAIQAANVLGVKLRIVGTGPEEARLRGMAGKHVTFMGKVSEAQLQRMYGECQALIFPQVEDFGLTAVEVQACGRPVVALRAGGALETVVPNRTGILFAEQTVSSLADAMQRATTHRWIKKSIQKHADSFDINVFKKKLHDSVMQQWEAMQ